MDLSDIRTSLLEQGWRSRNGKGSHEVWYPPGRQHRAISIPRHASKTSNQRRLMGLRASLRHAGWIDPEYTDRQSLPLRGPAEDTTESATWVADSTERTDMAPEDHPVQQHGELTVVEEAWATNSKTGRVSDCIKEQLMSDGSVRYHCADRYGAGCTYTSDKLMAVAAHVQLHRARIQIPEATPRATRATSATRSDTMRQRSQLRGDRAKEEIGKQVADMTARARSMGAIVREAALVPHGVSAGAPANGIEMAVHPDGKVTFECTAPGCGYTGEKFGMIFGHRKLHRRDTESNVERSAAAPVPTPAPVAARATSNGKSPEPDAAVGAALVRAVALKEAIADERPVIAAEAPKPAPPVAPAPKPSVPVTAAPPTNGSDRGAFREAVEYLREQNAQIVNHLQMMAASEYNHLAAIEAATTELEQVKAQLKAVQQHRDALRAEVKDLHAERGGLIAARDQLAQLRGMLHKLGGMTE